MHKKYWSDAFCIWQDYFLFVFSHHKEFTGVFCNPFINLFFNPKTTVALYMETSEPKLFNFDDI